MELDNGKLLPVLTLAKFYAAPLDPKFLNCVYI